MTPTTPAIQDLARRLIAAEAARNTSEAPLSAVRTCEKIRLPLVKLAGVAGFRSLMARALALATAELPWLHPVHVRSDGSLEGFDAATGDKDAAQAAEAGVVVVAQLLGLLVTFIGEPLTMSLVCDVWVDLPLDGTNRRVEDQS